MPPRSSSQTRCRSRRSLVRVLRGYGIGVPWERSPSVDRRATRAFSGCSATTCRPPVGSSSSTRRVSSWCGRTVSVARNTADPPVPPPAIRLVRRRSWRNRHSRAGLYSRCSLYSIYKLISVCYRFTSSYVFMKRSGVFHPALPIVHLGNRNGGDMRCAASPARPHVCLRRKRSAKPLRGASAGQHATSR